MRNSLALALLLAVPALGTPAAAGQIASACSASDRAGGNIRLCGCIQAVADRMLTRDDQRLAASFFKDPQRAQDVRMSKTDRDNLFWDRYERFGQAAAQNCN
ncbi:MAG: hypothetical protein KDA73_03150 [Rhodobacteraceae bacterium]|nr:hypothetical protein [Paracoccaceae bacterium]